ncbi:MAG: hypothetical protein FWF51_03145, partial [Chitinivibrionia bacterium]|nr:hypothetical protein [Chitinivibrionia bacterium]
VTPSEFRKLGFLQKITKADIKKKEVPTVPEIMAEQKRKISKEIDGLFNDDDLQNFEEWAKELLMNYSPEKLVSTLISAAYGDKFDTENYNELTPVKPKKDDFKKDRKKEFEKSGKHNKSEKFYKSGKNAKSGKQHYENKSNEFDEWKNRRFDKNKKQKNNGKHFPVLFRV